MAERRRAQEAAAATVLAAALACLRGPGGAKEPKEPLTAAALARPTLKTMQTALHLLHLRIRGAARTKKVRAAASAAGCPQLLRDLCAALSAVAGTGPRAVLSVRYFIRVVSPDSGTSICGLPYSVLQELQHIYPVLEPGQAKEFKAAMQEWVRELGERPQGHLHTTRLLSGLPAQQFAACQSLLQFAVTSCPRPLNPLALQTRRRRRSAAARQRQVLCQRIPGIRGTPRRAAAAGPQVGCCVNLVLAVAFSAALCKQPSMQATTCFLCSKCRKCVLNFASIAARWRWQRSWERGHMRRCPMPSCCGPAALPAPARRRSGRTRQRQTRSASCRLAWTQWWQPCSA